MLQIFDIVENSFNILFPPGHPNANIVKGFRALRAARLVIKLAVLLPALGTIMTGLAASLPAVFSLIACNILILFVFSIIAIEQFSGIFDACNVDGRMPTLDRGLRLNDRLDCVGTQMRPPSAYKEQKMWYDGVSADQFSFPAPVTWGTSGTIYSKLTFNDITTCYIAFYNLLLNSQIGSTTEALAAATDRDSAPVRMASPQNALFMIVFRILCGIFVAQVVVGIIMTNLKMKSGVAYHTEEQMVWPATKSALRNITHPLAGKRLPPEVDSSNALVRLFQMVQLKCFNLLENWKFQWFMTLTVVISCATQATQHFGASRSWLEITWWMNLTCLVLFVGEAIIKITYNINRYFRSGSDVFDFTITVVGVLEYLLLPKYGLELGLGSLRQFRLIRIGQNFPVFVNMQESIFASFPEAAAVVILLAVTLFIFGCILQTLFPSVKYGLVLSPNSNAGGQLNAMKLLFQMSSGAGGRDASTSWGHYVIDTSIAEPHCTGQSWLPTAPKFFSDATQEWEWFSPMGFGVGSSDATDCGNPLISTLFFFLFQFLIMFVIMPTFVASIINSYFNANLRKLSLISENDLDLFMEAWMEVRTSSSMQWLARGRRQAVCADILGKNCLRFHRLSR